MLGISVVIPLFNKALHVERALHSVLRQTTQDLEIIVVNDGSTDNGRELTAAINDPRVSLIDQPNQGVGAARNRGIEAARYSLVAFLDADDEWLPEFLEDIRGLVDRFPRCGAYAAAIQTVRPTGSRFLPSLSKLPPEPWTGILPDFFELFQDGLVFHPSSIVVPKPVLLEVGGFPEGEVLLEDITCWVKIALRHPIAFTPKRLVIYHQDATNRSNIHKNLREAPFVSLIQAALQDGSMPEGLRGSACEFVAQRQIQVATNNIMEGNPLYARRLLATCRGTRKYRSQWIWWRIWASLPAGWPNRLMLAKQALWRRRHARA